MLLQITPIRPWFNQPDQRNYQVAFGFGLALLVNIDILGTEPEKKKDEIIFKSDEEFPQLYNTPMFIIECCATRM